VWSATGLVRAGLGPLLGHGGIFEGGGLILPARAVLVADLIEDNVI
jgi:hypothetical protein